MISNIFQLIKKKDYWIVIVIIIFSGILTYHYNNSYENIKAINNTSINAFYFSTMKSNVFLVWLTPMLVISASNGGIFKYNSATIKSVFSVGIVGGSSVFIAQLIIYIFCSMFFARDTVFFDGYGTFSEIFMVSAQLYVILIFVHSFIVGFTYSIFGFAVSYNLIKSIMH